MLDDNNGRESEDELIVGEVILHFLEAPILGNLISPAKLPTRLTFDVGQTLRTIDRLPNNSWPLRVTLQTSR